MIFKNKTLLSIVLVGCGMAISGYYVGKSFSKNKLSVETKALASQLENLRELDSLDTQLTQQQATLSNKLSEVQNSIETVKLNLGMEEKNLSVNAAEIEKRLQELDAETQKIAVQKITREVPIPGDSPDGILINQPKSASGIPVKVLEKYEEETGVSPQEIEALMRRTE